MKTKPHAERPPAERRQSISDDVDAFIKAGNKIEYIPNGVSAQDPQGRGRPLRLGNSKGTTVA